jgi:Caspase domain/YDG domain/MBG domain (YGX type)
VGISGLTLAGADAGNYLLTPPVGVNASITPAPLSLAGVSVANKVYDATAAASATAGLGGVLAGDAVTVAVAASFSDANVGTAKTVAYSATTAGADAANYALAAASGSTVADITPATLVYVADALSARAGAALPPLTGSVTGFVGGQTLAGATTGTLSFTTPATTSSAAGNYAIDGSGLTAPNYQLVQAAGNATALTLGAAASSDPATTANQVSLTLALQSVQVPLVMSSPVQGRVLDVMPALALGGEGGDGGLSFRAVNFSLMPRDEVQSLLAARAGYKKKIFAGSLSKLELDPALADVPPCRTEAELDTGNCLVTEALKREIETIAARAVTRPRKADRRKVRQAALPNIERKLALLIGINTYDDKRVPELGGAVPDARAVRDLLEGRLGYETTVVENAKRETIVRAFNKLALEADANDSVVVYYAGHGEVVPVNGVDVGYWLPADVNPDEPKTWMSNSDIARMVAAIGARQVLLVSDSCYSGTLVGAEKVQLDQRTNADELLKRKAAVVLSSGGNEPVADEGRNGHSVFAWHFMRAIEGLDRWQVGSNVFERVRAAVVKDFPQTPQYGASRTAGHQGNTDYLFERREFEAVVPAPVQSPVPLTAPRR